MLSTVKYNSRVSVSPTCWNWGELSVLWISSALCGKLSPLGRKGRSLCWTSALARMGAIISGVQTLARSTGGEERRGGPVSILSPFVSNLSSFFSLFTFSAFRLLPFTDRLSVGLSLTCWSLSSRRWDVHGGEDALKVTELDGLVGGRASHRGWDQRSLSCSCKQVQQTRRESGDLLMTWFRK